MFHVLNIKQIVVYEMEQDNEYFDYLFKIVLIGDSGVGKTNILAKLLSNKFYENSKPTIGVEFGTKFYKFENNKIKIQIWDTAGQERYHAIISAYYRGAMGAIIVYDITNKETFKNAIAIWMENIKNSCNHHIPIMFLGNKTDLSSQREVKMEVALSSIESYDCKFFETSAQNGQNIDRAFEEFIEIIYHKEKGKNSLKNKLYVRREDLNGEELKFIQKKQKSGCC